VFPARYLLVRPGRDKETGRHPSWQYTAVLGWAGMRGVVTLAAAFAIPESFDYRETLILTALVVAAGTLTVQGSTLPILVRWLKLTAPDPREDALARAALFEKASAAGLEMLDLHSREDDPFNTIEALRQRAEQRNTAAWERLGSTHPEDETPSEAYARLRLEMLQAERQKVLHVRSTGTIPHAGERRHGAWHRRHDRRLRAPQGRAARRRLPCRVRVRGLRPRRLHRLGAPAQVPGVRAHGLLRLVAAQARQRALRRDRAPGDAVGRARRGVALVLRGQPARLTRLGTLAP
jgi:Sodium/hydrogen exchanger family